jgi:hypothetical protein
MDTAQHCNRREKMMKLGIHLVHHVTREFDIHLVPKLQTAGKRAEIGVLSNRHPMVEVDF